MREIKMTLDDRRARLSRLKQQLARNSDKKIDHELALGRAVKRAEKDRSKLTIFIIRLQNFNEVLERHDQDEINKILERIGFQAANLLPSSQEIFPYNTNDLMVILPYISAEQGKVLANALSRVIGTSYLVPNQTIDTRVRVGVGEYVRELAMEPIDLIQSALTSLSLEELHDRL